MDAFITDLQIAFRNLLQHTKRTLFLGSAIAGTTALLVLLVGLSTGIHDTMVRSATTLMTGQVNVGGFYKPSAGQSAPVVTEYEKLAPLLRKELPTLERINPRGRGWAKMISDTGSMQVGVTGVDIAGEKQFKDVVEVVSGDINELEKKGTILVFENQAKKIDVKVGDMVTISAPTTRGVNNTLDLRVAVIARDIGMLSSWNTFVPNESLRALYQLSADSTGVLQLAFKGSPDVGEIAGKLRKTLEAAGYRVMEPDPKPFWGKFDVVNREDWTGQKLDVTTWEDEISFMTWTLKSIDGLTVLLIGILLVIVVIGIMNTMWIAIRERTREIGTLRAIGMQRGKVLWLFLLEAGMLGLLGTLGGALVGILIATALNGAHIAVPGPAQFILMSSVLHLAVYPAAVVRAVLMISLITAIAALYPSYRATRLEPVTAMHHIG